MTTIKRTVRVTIEKEVEIEMLPGVFSNMTQEQYLEEFRKGLWHVDGIDDVVMYAARMAADMGGGYEHDGLGLLGECSSTYPRVPDVKFRIVSEDFDAEIVEAAS